MKRRLLAITVVLTLLLLLAAGCASSSKTDSAAADTVASAETSSSMDMGYGNSAAAPQEAPEADMVVEDAVTEESGDTREQKLIRTAYLELETTTFDESAAVLEALTQEMGGYFESSTVGDRGSGYSWGEYTIRVPVEQYSAFLNQAGELCHETWRNVTQDDITESYYDTQGRLKTQQIKLERLQALLAQAERMEDIITIESAISDTEWEIENLTGSLRHYDDLVDYATVHITLTEVYRLSNVEQVPDSFASRLGGAFTGGWHSFVEGLEDLAVSLAYSWMWILVLAVVVLAVLRTVLRRRKARRQALLESQKKDDSGKQT